MVAALASAGAVAAGRTVAGTIFGVFIIVVIASWALMFAVLIGILIVYTLLRGRRVRRRREAPPPGADPNLPVRLAQVRRADPDFDPQLLLEAAQMVCLVMFAAMSTGDEQTIRWLAAPSFWPTFFGKYLRTQARDARLQRANRMTPESQSRRYMRLPIDYQASAPKLISIEPGQQQRARVRVSFDQLRAIVSSNAQSGLAMAEADSLGSLAVKFGKQMNAPRAAGLGWLLWSGQYDLAFARPGDARTDPAASVASRTCARCGATYRSEFTTQCEHCHAVRPLAWGLWRLTDITPVA